MNPYSSSSRAYTPTKEQEQAPLISERPPIIVTSAVIMPTPGQPQAFYLPAENTAFTSGDASAPRPNYILIAVCLTFGVIGAIMGYLAEKEKFDEDEAERTCWGRDDEDSAAVGLGIADIIFTSIAFYVPIFALPSACTCTCASLFSWITYLSFISIMISLVISEKDHGDWDDCEYLADGGFALTATLGLISVCLSVFHYYFSCRQHAFRRFLGS
eukprot:TRINITY_DN9994_c0_g1::TRINITY_DN9994_c0_g1_i1::g.29254::m.29254 TRINITY_DN9994_c0_g1::TRINITY_DN9994_c0_g1_i1::g.29254  ORF type:complete len:215 (+),score=15.06,NB/PF04159.8/2.5 TRINITY_DN9994_c0_g1_i1:86-730(+)